MNLWLSRTLRYGGTILGSVVATHLVDRYVVFREDVLFTRAIREAVKSDPELAAKIGAKFPVKAAA